MFDLIIPALIFISVVALGSTVLLVRAGRNKQLRARLGDSRDQTDDVSAAPARSGLIRLLGVIGGKVSSQAPSPELRQKLVTAGYQVGRGAQLYLGAKLVLFIVGIVVVSVLVLPSSLSFAAKLFLIIAGATVLSILPNVAIAYRRHKRRQDIRHHFPDALDLLEISVSSGMGLDAAWNSVTDEIRLVSSTLSVEMALTNLELHLGASRAVALRHMAERTGAEEISSLVGALVQSDRFGTSIGDTLRTYASSMRETRSAQAEEAAEKTAVALLFPMVIFIFPVIMIVTVGPAGITLFKMGILGWG